MGLEGSDNSGWVTVEEGDCLRMTKSRKAYL